MNMILQRTVDLKTLIQVIVQNNANIPEKGLQTDKNDIK